jgi:FMN phosphatase YigB (HAD superfamily)
MAGERIAKEHEDIAEQETELEEYARRWQAQWRAHRYSPSADQEIRDLIDGINEEFEGIKKDYKQNRKDYTGVMQAMKLLARRARVAQVSVDESHVLNIDGQVIAFRG